MNGRVLLFKGQSRYNVVRDFIDDLAAAFNELGKETLVVDLSLESHTPQVIQEAFSKECAFACGFNLNGCDLGFGQEGIKFLQDVGIPYVGMLVDNPLYHFDKFRFINAVGMPENFVITCVDKYHLELMKCCSKISFSAFLPHAGSCAAQADRFKDMDRRSKDIVFCGSYSKPSISWANSGADFLLDDVAECMLSTENIQVQDALQEVLKARNYTLSPEFFQRLLCLSVHVDYYVRSIRRGKLISELAKLGASLNIYGNGWEDLSCTKTINVHKAVNFQEALLLMADAKITLNLVNSFSYGSHERVFSAMLNGSVALTDSNGYWRDEFEQDKEIVTYSTLKVDELPQVTATLLADIPRLNSIAEAGQKKVEQNHTWKARAQEIIKLVQMLDGISQ
ncbi:glycosyltransferase family protein [Pelosinus propionicus]|uniref:Glycosyl transferases group 1 n=1 Tax=Pelosinus propionicus DSM 13327 TaxID=1123291 RepID=A0A1I4HTI9_9FIRM|nr:glycosyltransferase [Pelosinus propionicus]SFL45519.1 Glycosyl transferases group 1 [Pelosinus propionicus DSM 13327]